MQTQEIFSECQRAGLTLQVDGSNIRVKPASNLTDDLQALLRSHKHELIEALADRHEAREERAAILEYDQGFTRKEADAEAAKRINYVSCGSCIHWTGASRCGAGLVTSGDDPQYPDFQWRICTSHTPKWKH